MITTLQPIVPPWNGTLYEGQMTRPWEIQLAPRHDSLEVSFKMRNWDGPWCAYFDWNAIKRPPKPKTRAEIAEELAIVMDEYRRNRLAWHDVETKANEWRNA